RARGPSRRRRACGPRGRASRGALVPRWPRPRVRGAPRPPRRPPRRPRPRRRSRGRSAPRTPGRRRRRPRGGPRGRARTRAGARTPSPRPRAPPARACGRGSPRGSPRAGSRPSGWSADARAGSTLPRARRRPRGRAGCPRGAAGRSPARGRPGAGAGRVRSSAHPCTAARPLRPERLVLTEGLAGRYSRGSLCAPRGRHALPRVPRGTALVSTEPAGRDHAALRSTSATQHEGSTVRTYTPKPGEVERTWYVIDATDVVLGRLASHVATLLRGKHKATFAPHVDTGDFVIVINADKVALSGNKRESKLAYRH